VTKGEITAYEGDDPKCRPTVHRAGEGFVDPGDGHVHVLRNETSAPAETVAVQILPKGVPRRIGPRPGQLPVLTTLLGGTDDDRPAKADLPVHDPVLSGRRGT